MSAEVEEWEGGYEVEYYDPVGCRVWTDEVAHVKTHVLRISGGYACASVEDSTGLAGLSIEVELCAEQWVPPLFVEKAIKCTKRTYDLVEYPAREIVFTVTCKPGELYAAWIWGWGEGGVPGGWVENGWDEESAPVIC